MEKKIIKINQANEAPNICTPCGGKCCQWSSGMLSVEQVMAASPYHHFVEGAEKLLSSGNYIMTSRHLAGYDRGVWVIVPRSDLSVGDGRFFYDNFGKCVFHTRSGCELSAEERPSECKSLVPSISGDCQQDNILVTEMLMSWVNYQQIMQHL